MQDQERYAYCLDQAEEARTAGRLEQALRWVDQALRANPQGPEAHARRGIVLWDGGRIEEAIHEFERSVEIEPLFWDAHLDRIEILIEEFQDIGEAFELADTMLEGPLEAPVEAEVYYLKAKALYYQDEIEPALFLLRRALQTHPDVPAYLAFEGQILLDLGRLESARSSLDRALGCEPDNAHAIYYLAHALDHLGQRRRAEGLFQQAARIAPDLFPLPVRMESSEFRAVAEAALAELPAAIAAYIANCPILIEELPDPEVIQEHEISPLSMGLFIGMPVTEPGLSPTLGTTPRDGTDRILLYQRNLETYAQSREDLVEQVQITVKHEIGHLLGLEEDDLDQLGLA